MTFISSLSVEQNAYLHAFRFNNIVGVYNIVICLYCHAFTVTPVTLQELYNSYKIF